MLRAYADDLAMVAKDLPNTALAFAPIFAEYAGMSGLALNLRKTVLIFLSEASMHAMREQLEVLLPGWGAVQVSHSSVYLGHALGPMAGEQCWAKALAKLERRAAPGGGLGFRLHHATVA